MSKELRLVKHVIEKADVIFEVVDARDPMATRTSELEKLAKRFRKPLIIVINKSDLVPRKVMEKWRKVLSKEYPTVYLSARERLGTRMLWKIAKKVMGDKGTVTVAVVGLPNVGKSTIINMLRGRHSAGTSPVPGYTKSDKTVRASTWLKVVDTPGIIPKGEEEELVIRSALRPESLEDPVPPAMRLIERLKAKDPKVFRRVYGVDDDNAYTLLEKIARRRGLLLKGDKLDVEGAARIVIRDWQTGKLTVYFTPEDYGLV